MIDEQGIFLYIKITQTLINLENARLKYFSLYFSSIRNFSFRNKVLTCFCSFQLMIQNLPDSGGWLVVSNYVIDSSSSPPQLSVETSYGGVGSYHNNKTFLTKSAMNELWTHLSFTQLRFHCSKQQGRTFHVTTVANSTGEAVVQYFCGQTDVQPDACGSFVRMENDNSILAGACDRWNYRGKWGWRRDEDRLYVVPAGFPGNYWLLRPNYPDLRCDDSYGVLMSAGDFWRVFVR